MISIAVMFPAAIVINLIVLRFARTRTWDRQPWRSWLGGGIAVALVWVSYYVAIACSLGPPEPLIQIVGSDIAKMIHGLGILLTASAISLMAAWSLPPPHVRTAP